MKSRRIENVAICVVRPDTEARVALGVEAIKRGIGTEELVNRIVETVVREGLVQAVLDD